MKRLLLLFLPLLAAAMPLHAQLYHPGEVLSYRVSYRAKMFPNTEVGAVEVTTTQEQDPAGKTRYKVVGKGRTLPAYRWFYNLEDTYTVWVDPQTLLPQSFESDIHEGDYTFRSHYAYDWENQVVNTRWRSRQNPEQQKQMPLTAGSLDAVSLFFNLRTASPDNFREGETAALRMVLQDTIRDLRYRYLGREVKKIRNMGRYKTLKFECELGSTEEFSFSDGTVFTVWISDDQNKIPLYIESPVKIGSINAYVNGYKGLKHPMTSLIE